MAPTITQSDRDDVLDQHLCTFVVEGRGTFPLDMLRRDQCWPTGPDDTARISFDRNDGDLYTRDRCVKLTMFRRLRYPNPNAPRWESFGWKVLETDERGSA